MKSSPEGSNNGHRVPREIGQQWATMGNDGRSVNLGDSQGSLGQENRPIQIDGLSTKHFREPEPGLGAGSGSAAVSRQSLLSNH